MRTGEIKTKSRSLRTLGKATATKQILILVLTLTSTVSTMAKSNDNMERDREIHFNFCKEMIKNAGWREGLDSVAVLIKRLPSCPCLPKPTYVKICEPCVIRILQWKQANVKPPSKKKIKQDDKEPSSLEELLESVEERLVDKLETIDDQLNDITENILLMKDVLNDHTEDEMQKMATTSVKSVSDMVPYTQIYEWPIGHRIRDISVSTEVFNERLEIFHNHIKSKTLTLALVLERSAKWITYRDEETGDFLGSVVEFEDDFQREVLQTSRKKSEDDMIVPQKVSAPRSRSRKSSFRLTGRSNLPIEHQSITKRLKKERVSNGGLDDTVEDDDELRRIIGGNELGANDGDVTVINGGRSVASDMVENTRGEPSKVKRNNNDTADCSLDITAFRQTGSGSNASTPSPKLVIDEGSTSEEREN